LNILLPATSPDQSQTSFSDRCHGSTLANNIASSFVLDPKPENLEKAERWAGNAVHIARHTIKDAEAANKADEAIECGSCLAVGLFNAGLLKEVCLLALLSARLTLVQMKGNTEEAIKLVQQAYQQARSVRFVEGSRQALSALDRLHSKSTSSKS
jgi:hypothetical protein